MLAPATPNVFEFIQYFAQHTIRNRRNNLNKSRFHFQIIWYDEQSQSWDQFELNNPNETVSNTPSSGGTPHRLTMNNSSPQCMTTIDTGIR